jgi:hypothetical protein
MESFITFVRKFFDVLKSLPTWSRIVVLLAMAAVAFALSSCSRSTIRFKGEGQIDFMYKGTNGPTLVSNQDGL